MVKHTAAHRFVVLPKRWIVEPTFAWRGGSRSFSKGYESRPETAETVLHIAADYPMLRQLAS